METNGDDSKLPPNLGIQNPTVIFCKVASAIFSLSVVSRRQGEGRYQGRWGTKAVFPGASHFCKNTPALANGIEPPARYALSEAMPKASRGYTNKTHLRGFQILRVRVGGLRLCSRDF
ncbi:hypothetical protein [Nostoc sp. UHCC 0252]|uniref:hypothetical protein n=1 Tax=Nostoc sp. UHCC 0252 TaxID=3110241 RepID=UPI002B205379|nr:hypothetical protein [Nostoc sp. UHCC 0252]MEA5604401.1 hypothetical protein [Nostoc sp. UHCC 0252]